MRAELSQQRFLNKLLARTRFDRKTRSSCAVALGGDSLVMPEAAFARVLLLGFGPSSCIAARSWAGGGKLSLAQVTPSPPSMDTCSGAPRA